jgi:two-component system, NarL family, nitrate/nitrite response regulator NarL
MAASEIRLLVIGPKPGLTEATVRALKASGIRVSGDAPAASHLRAIDGADVLLLQDARALDDLIDARGDDGLLPVVIQSFESHAPAALRRAGAPGWAIVPPDSAGDELAAAIVAASRGFAVQPASSPAQSRDADDPDDDRLDRLTERERDVLELLSEGLANKAIAARLGISGHTVKFHLSAIFSKLGVSTRTEAVRRGVRRGLIEF